MPSTNEVVVNRPLSGLEAKRIILQDVAAILDRDGLFTEYVAFGRLAYDIIIKVHLDNPTYPEHETRVRSRPQPDQNPVVERGPLTNPTEDAKISANRRSRVVDSPNKERIKRGMPITVDAKDRETGHMAEKQLTYDVTALPEGERELDEGAVDSNITDEVVDGMKKGDGKKGWEM